MNRSRSTGWESVLLARIRPPGGRSACDVAARCGSPYAAIYLHRCGRRQGATRGFRVFDVADSTYLDPHSAEMALLLSITVTDRYGGTRYRP